MIKQSTSHTKYMYTHDYKYSLLYPCYNIADHELSSSLIICQVNLETVHRTPVTYLRPVTGKLEVCERSETTINSQNSSCAQNRERHFFHKMKFSFAICRSRLSDGYRSRILRAGIGRDLASIHSLVTGAEDNKTLTASTTSRHVDTSSLTSSRKMHRNHFRRMQFFRRCRHLRTALSSFLPDNICPAHPQQTDTLWGCLLHNQES